MRILDPILTAALESGNYQPFFRFEHRATKGAAPYITTDNVLNFSIGSTEFTVTLYNVTVETTENNAENEFGRIIRGCVVNGVEYSVSTSDFFITEYKRDDNYRYITGAIVPRLTVDFLADGTYEEVLTEYCALFGLTAVFKEPTDAWLDYQFFADGKQLNLNRADALFPLLLQKYLITATDNGDNELLFSHAFSGIATPEYTITDPRFKINLFNKSRRYVSRDEAATIHYTGDADAPLHNLGYLHSTASNPTVTVTNGDQEAPPLPIHLKYQTGDYIQMRTEQAALLLLQDLSSFFMINDSTYLAIGSLSKLFKIEVTEELDTRKFKELPWRVTIKSLPIFNNTEGGALPSTIERVASYTPLVTKNFDKNLDATVNNLQALAEAVDELDKFVLGAGSTAAGSAPLKFTDGPLMTVVETGAMEYKGHTFYLTTYLVRRSIVLAQDVLISDVTVANNTTETTIYSVAMAANYLIAGKHIKIDLTGIFSSIAGPSGVLTLRVKYAGATVATLVTAAALNTNSPFRLEVNTTCRAIGSGTTGKLLSFTEFQEGATTATMSNSVVSGPLTNIDTTLNNTITITAQWASANAGNTITVQHGHTLCIDANT